MTDVWLNFTLNGDIIWIGYSLDHLSNVTISNNTLLSNLSEGTHLITLYVMDIEGFFGNSSKIWFTIDTLAPIITIISPENITYYPLMARCVDVTFTVNEPTLWIGYSLDGDSNNTNTENFTQCTLENGSHSLVLYARDRAGNIGSSSVWFTLSIPDLDPPVVEVYGVSDGATYTGELTINVTITDENPIGFAGVWLSKHGQPAIISYQTDRDTLTIVRISNNSWTFTVSIDTTEVPDGEYHLSINVYDIYGNSHYPISQFDFRIYIKNTETTLGSKSSLQPRLTPGFLFICLFISIIPLTLKKKDH